MAEQFIVVNNATQHRQVNLRTVFTIDNAPDSDHKIEITFTHTSDRILVTFANQDFRDNQLTELRNRLAKGNLSVELIGGTMQTVGPFLEDKD